MKTSSFVSVFFGTLALIVFTLGSPERFESIYSLLSYEVPPVAHLFFVFFLVVTTVGGWLYGYLDKPEWVVPCAVLLFTAPTIAYLYRTDLMRLLS